LVAVAAAAILAGCAAPAKRQTPELKREAGVTPNIVVMPLDVELSQLTAGGLEEPQAEWAEAAHKHMRAALEEEAKRRQVTLLTFDPERGTPEDRETSLALVALHRAVGSSALLHQYMQGFALPSKQGKFDCAFLGLGLAVAGAGVAGLATVVRTFQTSMVEGHDVKAVPVASGCGFRFETRMVGRDEVERDGVFVGTIRNKKLYGAWFQGAKLHYFGRYLPEFENVVASAQLVGEAAK
jgi:hypothetical protein